MSAQLQITDLGEVDKGYTLPEGKVADLVSLAEMKNYLKQSYTNLTLEDRLIEQMIQSARRWIEGYINKSVIQKTIVAFTTDELAEFDLPMPPVTTITSVKRVDLQGTETTLTKNTDYYEIGLTEKTLQFMAIWATVSYSIAGIKVTYTAKMEDAGELDICKTACMMIVAENYYHRGEAIEPTTSLIPFDAKRILQPIRLLRTL